MGAAGREGRRHPLGAGTAADGPEIPREPPPPSYFLAVGATSRASESISCSRPTRRRGARASRRPWSWPATADWRSSARAAGAKVLGFVPDAQLEAVYTTALALVSASREEGFGFPPLEALARGVPAVVPDLLPFRETLGDAAIRYPQADASARRRHAAAGARARAASAAGRKQTRPSRASPGRRPPGAPARCCARPRHDRWPPVLIDARAAVRKDRWRRARSPRAGRTPAVLRPDRYAVARPPAALAHRAGHPGSRPCPARRYELILCPANLALLASRRNVVVIHDVAPVHHPGWYSPLYAGYQRRLLPAIARRARLVITVSEFARGSWSALWAYRRSGWR